MTKPILLRRRRRAIAAAMAGTMLAVAAPSARAIAPLADMRGCKLTLHVLMDDPQRLQPRFVPSHYRPRGWTPGQPFIALWSMGCDEVRVGGSAPRPAHLSIAAVTIEHPDRQPAEQPPFEMPNLWAHYVHSFHSDHPDLVDAFERQGLPAKLAPGMSMRRDVILPGTAPLRDLAETRAEVPGAWSSWTQPLIQHEPPHSHQNSFWFDGPSGPVVIELRIPLAVDHFCELSAGERCGTVTAAPGSEAADLIGAERRSADAAVDHDPVERGVMVAFPA